MKSSYNNQDVTILLNDITGKLKPLNAEQREKLIQSGVHYSEMLPLEYESSQNYMEAYKFALENMSGKTAGAVAALSETILSKKGKEVVLVSLARAGIPAGILVKRYLKNKYGLNISHYAISIIRGRGIDVNAVNYILHRHEAHNVQFIDGWIGKGAIARELKRAVSVFEGLDFELAAISDPSGTSDIVGTYEDLLIPSALLNSVVTGLISRTVLNKELIGEKDFHGAAYYANLEPIDLSIDYIDTIVSKFNYNKCDKPIRQSKITGIETVMNIAEKMAIKDINFIKPGIGETTRVLLRRVPDVILINEKYKNSLDLNHLYELARERKVPCQVSDIDLGEYKTVGIIKRFGDV